MDTKDAALLRQLQDRLTLTARQVEAGPWVYDLAEMAEDIAKHLADQAREPQVRKCDTCAYGHDTGYGQECRFNPPQVVMIQGNVSFRFPRMGVDDWCGRWAEDAKP